VGFETLVAVSPQARTATATCAPAAALAVLASDPPPTFKPHNNQ
jgi:hypothetical protein